MDSLRVTGDLAVLQIKTNKGDGYVRDDGNWH